MKGDVDVRGRRVVVIGAAVAGAAAAEVLTLEGADVLVSEARPAEQLDTLARLHQLGIDHTKLTVRHNGIDRRLTNVEGEVVDGILA